VSRLEEILGGLLIGAFAGLAIACLFAPAHAGGYPPNSEPIQRSILAITAQRGGCPRGQYRAYLYQGGYKPFRFCWRPSGDLIEVLSGPDLVITVPASRFAPDSKGVSP